MPSLSPRATSSGLRPFDGYELGPDEQYDFRKSPRVRSSVLAALLLVLGGLLLTTLGLAMYAAGHEKMDWVPAIVLGGLCLIPGSYASYLAWGAYKQWRGFSWDAIPSYQEVD